MYKKEDLKFLNMKTERKYVPHATSRDGYYNIFEIEKQLSQEEKIKFIDELKDGIASYVLNILNIWQQEKDSLPKDNYKDVKTVSKKAWIKRNDDRKFIDTDYKIGRYYMFETQYKNMSLVCPNTEYGYNMAYTDDNIINQWFHDLCLKLYREEKEYFESINPLDIKIVQIKKYVNRYGCLDSKKINDIAWNGDKDIKEEELDIYLEAYDKIEKYIENTIKEVKNKITL